MNISVVSTLPSSEPPFIGIFWGIQTDNNIHLICAGAALEDAETYGEMLTYSLGHYEIWEGWQRLGATQLARKGFPSIIATTLYDQWPRGRVVHNLSTRSFILYADRKLQQPAILTRVMTTFGLPPGLTSIQSDAHYTT